MKHISIAAIAVAVIFHAGARADRDYSQTVEMATQVLREMSDVSDGGVPPALMRKASGVVVIPSIVKAGFIFGARRGRGVMMARDQNGQWSSPVFVTLTGGSFGFQAGYESTDLILVMHSRRSINDIVRRRKLTLNADAGVAAGPVGRQVGAGTDIEFRSEIYSYSRNRGLFAGASLDGSALRVDYEGIEDFYRDPSLAAGDILNGRIRATSPVAQRLVAALNTYSSQGARSLDRSSSPPVQQSPPSQSPPATSTPQKSANYTVESFQPPVTTQKDPPQGSNQETTLINAAVDTIRGLAGDSDRAVPRKIAEQAYAVVVVPDLVRAGFVASGQYGRGVMTVRGWDGEWSNPVFLSVAGGGIGLQAGVQSSEWILVFKTRRAVNEVIRRRKLTLGVDAAASAGPIGREVGLATDAQMRAEIFSYSKSRGIFAGASMGGSVLRIDEEANEQFYRRDEIFPTQIVTGDDLDPPPVARSFRDAMGRGFPASR